MDADTILSKRASIRQTNAPLAPGSVSLTPAEVTWTPDDAKAAGGTRTIAVKEISALQRSKAGGPKPSVRIVSSGGQPVVLDFLNEADRDAFCDAAAAEMNKIGLKGKGAASADGAAAQRPPAAPKVPTEVLVCRRTVLSSNAELSRLHARLVGSGIVAEEEFWDNHRELVEDLSAKRGLGQRQGLASTFMAEPTKDGRSREVVFSLDREKIHQIFSIRPAVRLAYLAHVPARMTDEEFWHRYCRAMIVKKARRGKAPATEQEAADLKMFAEDDERNASELLQQVKEVDPTLDLAAADYDALNPGFGIARDGRKEDPNLVKRRKKEELVDDVIRDLNRHGAVVLDGVPETLASDSAALARSAASRSSGNLAAAAGGADDGRGTKRKMEYLTEYLRLDDLQAPAGPRQEQLKIQDPRNYFESSSRAGSSVDASTSGGAHAARHPKRPTLAQEMARVAVGDPRQPAGATFSLRLDSATAIKVWNELAQAANLGDPAAQQRAAATAPGGQQPARTVPEGLMAKLRETALVANDLLRVFWASHPPGTSTAKAAKCERVVKELESLYNEIEAEKGKMDAGGRHSLYQVTRALVDAMNKAFEAHDACA